MKERLVQKQIIDYLKDKGYVIKVISSNRSGTPDIIACIKGVFYGIEVKSPGKKHKVSELQKIHLKQIEESGGFSIVADGLKDIKEKGL